MFSIGSLAVGTSESRNIVDGLGDINGDGHDEFIIGTPGAFVFVRIVTPGSLVPVTEIVKAGSVQIYSGKDGSAISTFNGSAEGDLFGSSIANIGDVDFDNIEDFLVGAPGSDNLSGSVSAFSGATGKLLWEVDGAKQGDQVGFSVGSIGDVNGDNRPDVLVSAAGLGVVTVKDGFTGKTLFL